ncbi:hypothetical protein TNCV_120131 [Trichonephila clavipes]|nr:hypothetical protein TNCV_120131 [Trichonephila clavipes]
MDFCRSSFVVHPQYWIRNRNPWKKRTWHLSDSRAYRQYEAEDKRLFRDAIQLAIIDAKTPTTVFFLTSTTGDDQGLSERYLHQAFSESLQMMRLSVGETLGSLVGMITSKNPVFHIRLRGCRLVGLREKPENFVVRICFSVRHLTRDIINEQFICDSKFLAGHQATRCVGNNT